MSDRTGEIPTPEQRRPIAAALDRHIDSSRKKPDLKWTRAASTAQGTHRQYLEEMAQSSALPQEPTKPAPSFEMQEVARGAREVQIMNAALASYRKYGEVPHSVQLADGTTEMVDLDPRVLRLEAARVEKSQAVIGASSRAKEGLVGRPTPSVEPTMSRPLSQQGWRQRLNNAWASLTSLFGGFTPKEPPASTKGPIKTLDTA